MLYVSKEDMTHMREKKNERDEMKHDVDIYFS